jgi:hypothetical protein
MIRICSFWTEKPFKSRIYQTSIINPINENLLKSPRLLGHVCDFQGKVHDVLLFTDEHKINEFNQGQN